MTTSEINNSLIGKSAKHFELTSESIVDLMGRTLFRVKLTRDCKWGKAGDLGGWVQKDENIQDSAWVSGNARVSGDARVYGNAWVSGDARVYGNAWVSGDAQVYGNAWVSGNARVSGDAQVSGDAWVSGDARVYGNARVYEDVWETSPLQIQGSRHFITECKKGFLQIGCECYTFKEWSLHFEAIGKAEGYSEKQIKEYKLYIDLAISLNSLD